MRLIVAKCSSFAIADGATNSKLAALNWRGVSAVRTPVSPRGANVAARGPVTIFGRKHYRYTWRRWAEHAPRLGGRDPTRLYRVVVGWQAMWWRDTLEGVLLTDSDPNRSRSDRGDRRLGKKQRDDRIQGHAEEGAGQKEP